MLQLSKQQLGLSLAFSQGVLGLPTDGDILSNFEDTPQPAASVAQRLGRSLDEYARAVFLHVPAYVAGLAAALGFGEFLLQNTLGVVLGCVDNLGISADRLFSAPAKDR